jgi:hypothetical protein
MTLVITRASNRGVLQVADRLVTTQSGARFDELANKNLVYLAKDAIASIAYTGLAYLEELPTDVWLARELTGLEIHRLMRGINFGSTPEQLHAYAALQKIARGLNRVLSSGPRMAFDLIMAGFKWSRSKPPKAFVWQASYDRETGLRLGTMPRNWQYPTKTLVRVIPGSNFPRADMNSLSEELRGASDPRSTETVMVNAVRRIANNNRYVGSDCMSIRISPPSLHYIGIRFLPAVDRTAMVGAHGERATVKIAYSPWVISSKVVMPPMIMVGATRSAIGGDWFVDLDAPDDRDIRLHLSAQRRPRIQ